MTQVMMSKDKIKKNLDFVIYNYLAEEKKITYEKFQKDFKERYDLDFTLERVKEIISKYVKYGILSETFRYFVFISH